MDTALDTILELYIEKNRKIVSKPTPASQAAIDYQNKIVALLDHIVTSNDEELAKQKEDRLAKRIASYTKRIEYLEDPKAVGRKKCSGCREWLRIDAFGPQAKQSSGIDFYCRPCARWYRLQDYYKTTKKGYKKRPRYSVPLKHHNLEYWPRKATFIKKAVKVSGTERFELRREKQGNDYHLILTSKMRGLIKTIVSPATLDPAEAREAMLKVLFDLAIKLKGGFLTPKKGARKRRFRKPPGEKK